MEQKYNLKTFIDSQLSRSNISYNRSKIAKDIAFNYEDQFIGLSILVIKEIIFNINTFHYDINELISSKYNELRILGWAILIKTVEDVETFKNEVLINIKNINNYNDCDFSSSMISSYLIKKHNKSDVINLGYKALHNADSLWEYRFILMLSLELVETEHYNYPLDVVERLLHFDQPIIYKPILKILLKIKQKNLDLLKVFLAKNTDKINKNILSALYEKN